MNRLALTGMIASLATGCIIIDDDPVVIVDGNDAPALIWADAGCYWSDPHRDTIWWFEAEVFDADGRGDITAVYADVFDARGAWTDSFELYPETPDPDVWFSDWLEYSTYLWCGDAYTIDFVVYDRSDAWDSYTIAIR